MAAAYYLIQNVSVGCQDLPQAVHESEFIDFIDKTLEVARD